MKNPSVCCLLAFCLGALPATSLCAQTPVAGPALGMDRNRERLTLLTGPDVLSSPALPLAPLAISSRLTSGGVRVERTAAEEQKIERRLREVEERLKEAQARRAALFRSIHGADGATSEANTAPEGKSAAPAEKQ